MRQYSFVILSLLLSIQLQCPFSPKPPHQDTAIPSCWPGPTNCKFHHLSLAQPPHSNDTQGNERLPSFFTVSCCCFNLLCQLWFLIKAGGRQESNSPTVMRYTWENLIIYRGIIADSTVIVMPQIPVLLGSKVHHQHLLSICHTVLKFIPYSQSLEVLSCNGT